jgi:hypothetical protein
METSFERSKAMYKSKVPDIEQTLELVCMMKKKQDDGEGMTANYSLNDTIYAKAKVNERSQRITSPFHKVP